MAERKTADEPEVPGVRPFCKRYAPITARFARRREAVEPFRNARPGPAAGEIGAHRNPSGDPPASGGDMKVGTIPDDAEIFPPAGKLTGRATLH